MKRKLALVATMLILASLGYVATALGLGSEATSAREWSSVQPKVGAPTVPITGQDLAVISGMINSHGADTQFGISPTSYLEAQQITSTSAGDLYLITGHSGMCLAFLDAVSCSNREANGMIVALAAPSPRTGELVGGGVVATGTHHVALAGSNGSTTVPASDGTFVIDEGDHVRLDGSPLRFEGRP